jgi:hypothetical protein
MSWEEPPAPDTARHRRASGRCCRGVRRGPGCDPGTPPPGAPLGERPHRHGALPQDRPPRCEGAPGRCRDRRRSPPVRSAVAARPRRSPRRSRARSSSPGAPDRRRTADAVPAHHSSRGRSRAGGPTGRRDPLRRAVRPELRRCRPSHRAPGSASWSPSTHPSPCCPSTPRAAWPGFPLMSGQLSCSMGSWVPAWVAHGDRTHRRSSAAIGGAGMAKDHGSSARTTSSARR